MGVAARWPRIWLDTQAESASNDACRSSVEGTDLASLSRATVRSSSAVSAIVGICAVGLDLLVDMFGARTVIAEAVPVLEAFLPIIGVVAVAMGLSLAVGMLHAWDQARATFHERELNNYAFRSDPTRPGIDELDDAREVARFVASAQMAKKWIPISKHDAANQFAAQHAAELFRTYGYLRGRIRVRRLRRQLKSKIDQGINSGGSARR